MESDRRHLVRAFAGGLALLLLPCLAFAEEPLRTREEIAGGHLRRVPPPDEPKKEESPVPSNESKLAGSRGEAEPAPPNPFRSPAPPKPWHVTLILEGQHDTNPFAPTEIIAPGAIDLAETWLMTTVLTTGYEFRPNDDLEIHLDVLWYAEYHDHVGRLDLDSVNLSGSVRWWLTQMLSVGVRTGTTHQWLGGEDLLSIVEEGPFVSYAEGDWTQTTVAWNHKNKEYTLPGLPGPLDADSERDTLSISQDVLLPGTGWLLSVSYAWSAVHADGSDYDGDLHRFTLGIGGPLVWGVKSSFETSLLFGYFQDSLLAHPPFSDSRQDRQVCFTARCERPIVEHLTAYAYLMYMDSDSTIQFFQYDRQMVGFGFVIYY